MSTQNPVVDTASGVTVGRVEFAPAPEPPTVQALSAVFESGARSSELKPRYALIPQVALERLAMRYTEGAAKHGEQNYQRGARDARYREDRLNHALEHLLRYASGDRSDDHLAAAAWGCMTLMWFESQP